ncbi:acyl-CoA synthetase [Chondromyces apiculatus]|uniref:Long-chain-fatty-acid--CoA ligase n=1 Tax=Chondromyces apiculatus DSM 436 TaxID=1192034 RepID=A0A017TCI5_9BACT|nr:long-chain fatty acid--CoA ligase [Chondromyces apiculatus]EYF06607.1 Long-chain-fatty-acid--CoA ligase [Chondromyces apiculatus DSM 436]
MLFGDWLGRRAQLSPGRLALIDTLRGETAITYRDWNLQTNRTAHLLQREGIRRGDRVAVLAKNCVEQLDLWFACGKLGAILQPLNWRLTPHELASLLGRSRPALLVYGPDFLSTLDALRDRPETASIRRWLPLSEAHRATPADLPFAARDTCPDHALSPVDLGPDDPWVLCTTGGSTGLPKAAVLTHGNITWNAINTTASWSLTPDDLAILNAPLFHTGGLNVFTAPLVHIGGASIVCREFNADQVYDLIEQHPVSLFFGVPTMFLALAEHARWSTAHLDRLKLVISGGAPCPLPLFERFWQCGIASFKTGYGLTEAGPNTFWLPDEEVQKKPGAVGYPLMHVDIRIAGADGRECGAGEVGELLVRGPHVCAGYWEDAEATAGAIREGWLHTGDLAERDAEGCVRIVGRAKEVIISGGENIYPAEVENVLATHPKVVEVALIGVPDERWGEVGRAVVVARGELDVEELLAFARERLAKYKVPRSVVLVEALPRTSAGKVDKRGLVTRSHSLL